MKKINWSFVKVIALFIASILLWSFTHNRYKHRDLNEVSVIINYENGNHFVDKKVVEEILSSTHPDYPNMALNKVYIRDMELSLRDYPFVKEAQVYKYHDGNLYTNIEQVEPVIRIKDKNSEFYITKEGKRVPLSSHFSSKVLILTGEIDSTTYQAISELAVNINNRDLLKSYIIGIKKKNENSFVFFTIDSGYVVNFGDLTNVDDKLDKLEVFYKEFIQKYPNHPYYEFNLGFKNQIVGKRNEK